MSIGSTLRYIGFAALGITLTGCVSQDQYSALKLERDRIAEQLVQSQREASTSASAAKAYKDQLEQIAAGGSTQAALVANLTQQNATLQSQLDDLNRRYAEAMARPMTGGAALPPVLNDALNAFAQANPDLVDFDSARGIVKFKSDVVFNTGDASLTPKAREVIDRFAKILNSSAASQYELLVAGHTDNQRVSNPATIQAGHKDNWYLSAHRAITVGEELTKTGVNPARLGVVGYADQRPIASNSSAAGQQQNRRVEVLILPNQVRNAAPKGVATGNGKAAKTAGHQINKDSPTSSINK